MAPPSPDLLILRASVARSHGHVRLLDSFHLQTRDLGKKAGEESIDRLGTRYNLAPSIVEFSETESIEGKDPLAVAPSVARDDCQQKQEKKKQEERGRNVAEEEKKK